ncbi:MAG TPA: response regulator [Methanospirillum sp.]|nr:response regulator [Methanospirillum sp.]
MGPRILLLDDEPAICEITSILLNKLGYEPFVTSKGEEAIDIYQEGLKVGRPIALAILDLSIPGGIGGHEVIAALRAMDPDVKALVSSGDANDPAVMDPAGHGFVGVLMKPYNKAGLDAAIRSIIAFDS